jgi:hypothetical protein
MGLKFNFGRKVRRVARRQYRRGELDRATYERLCTESRDGDKVKVWKSAVETKLAGSPWLCGDAEDDPTIWERIRAWLIANWPAILKIIITIIMLADKPVLGKECEDEKCEDKTEQESE